KRDPSGGIASLEIRGLAITKPRPENQPLTMKETVREHPKRQVLRSLRRMPSRNNSRLHLHAEVDMQERNPILKSRRRQRHYPPAYAPPGRPPPGSCRHPPRLSH